MSAAADAIATHPRPFGLLWLRHELAASPGRSAMTLRLVVAVVAVVVISMALQTPATAYSAYMVFFVTKENRVVTTILATALVVGATLAIAVSLLLSLVTIDAPHLRVPAMAVVLFCAMFLSRATVIGPLFFAIGFVLALTQSLTEAIPDAEHLVRGFLWLWAILVFPMPITVVVNRLVLTADPWKALQRSLKRRLGSAAATVRGTVGPSAAVDEATRGSAALFEQLKHATLIHPHVKLRQASLSSAIVASERLLVASAALRLRDGDALSDGDRRRVEQLADRLSNLQAALPEPGRQTGSRSPSDDVAILPELRDLERAAEALTDSLERHDDTGTAPATPPARKSLFVPDAFTNPDYARFALKVTIAAMSCYVIYTALNWPAIRTAFITCCFIALENLGATIHKGTLRLAGCAIGGLMGFLSLMYLLPYMESIVSLALLTAAGTAIAGWVAAGTDRVAYAGLQIALAFFLSIFQGVAPDTQFHPIRDRVVGIVLGIVVSSVVFRFLWPERASDRMRAALVRALRSLARLALVPAVGAPVPEAAQRAETLRREIGKDLDETRKLEELSVLEGDAGASLEGLIHRAQVVSVTTSALVGDAALTDWARLDATTQSAEAARRAEAAGRLGAAADIAAGLGEPGARLTWKETSPLVGGNDRVPLVERLVQQTGG